MIDIGNIKARWGIKSTLHFIVIMIVFAITGSLALYLSNPVLNTLNINSETTNKIIYYPLRLIIIFPIYQLVLIITGTLFGQFAFFWELEKKMIKRLGILRLLRIFQKSGKSNL